MGETIGRFLGYNFVGQVKYLTDRALAMLQDKTEEPALLKQASSAVKKSNTYDDAESSNRSTDIPQSECSSSSGEAVHNLETQFIVV